MQRPYPANPYMKRRASEATGLLGSRSGVVKQVSGDVGELAVEADVDAGELGPAVAGAGAQLLATGVR